MFTARVQSCLLNPDSTKLLLEKERLTNVKGVEWLGLRVTVCVKLLVTRAVQSIEDPPMK